MKKSLFVTCIVGALLYFSETFAASLLWNPGPKYKAGLTWATGGGQTCSSWVTDLSQGHQDGNPVNACSGGYWCEGTQFVATNGSCESYNHDTRVGWTLSYKNTYPGWSIWTLAGGNGVPIEYQYLNHAKTISDPCTLREVGLIFDRINGSGNYAFKRNANGTPYKLGQWPIVNGTFKAKKATIGGPPACSSYPTGYVTADFRASYVNSNGVLVRSDLLGTIVLNINNFDGDGNPNNNIFWSDGCVGSSCRKILHGNKLGYPSLTTNYQTYTINYKALLTQYNPPPAGFTINDAIISGFDIYTSVRGADVDFIVKEADVIGQ